MKARHEDVYSAGGGTQLGSHAQLSRSDRDAEYSACAIGPECPSGGKRNNAFAKQLVVVTSKPLFSCKIKN